MFAGIKKKVEQLNYKIKIVLNLKNARAMNEIYSSNNDNTWYVYTDKGKCRIDFYQNNSFNKVDLPQKLVYPHFDKRTEEQLMNKLQLKLNL